jgi:hypothetical protein
MLLKDSMILALMLAQDIACALEEIDVASHGRHQYGRLEAHLSL